jgi:hypothetical protein
MEQAISNEIAERDRRSRMTEIVRKLMAGLALLVVGGLVLGGTIAFAGNSPSPSTAVSSSSASDSPSRSVAPGTANDDGTPDQGPGDVPVVGGNASTDDDGTADQGPGDADGEHNDDHADEVEDGNDDHSGPSENSGPGSVDDDDSGHGEND